MVGLYRDCLYWCTGFMNTLDIQLKAYDPTHSSIPQCCHLFQFYMTVIYTEGKGGP